MSPLTSGIPTSTIAMKSMKSMKSIGAARKNMTVPETQDYQERRLSNDNTADHSKTKGRMIGDSNLEVVDVSGAVLANVKDTKGKKDTKVKKDKPGNASKRSGSVTIKSPENNKKQFKCKVCDELFKNKSSRQWHQENKHFGKEYKCLDCDQIFKQAKNLKLHQSRKTVDNEMKYCAQCGKKFCLNHQFIRHKKTHNANKKWFVCQRCDKRYSTKSALYDHTMLHTGTKQHSCDKCSASFYYRTSLKVHLSTHTEKNKESGSCPYCNKQFATKGNAAKHAWQCRYKLQQEEKSTRTNKHENKKVKVGPASKQKKTISKPSAKQVYNKQRVEYQECPQYATKASFNSHEAAHVDRNGHLCETCGQTLFRKSALAAHHRMHNEKKSCQRQQRGKSVTSPENLVRHVQQHCHSAQENEKSIKINEHKDKEVKVNPASEHPERIPEHLKTQNTDGGLVTNQSHPVIEQPSTSSPIDESRIEQECDNKTMTEIVNIFSGWPGDEWDELHNDEFLPGINSERIAAFNSENIADISDELFTDTT